MRLKYRMLPDVRSVDAPERDALSPLQELVHLHARHRGVVHVVVALIVVINGPDLRRSVSLG